MSEVQKLAVWIPMTHEAIEDAPLIRLGFEYMMFGRQFPLTAVERLTGWRSFTSSDGLTAQYRVGWRLDLWHKLRIARCAATGHRLGPWEREDEDWRVRECECRTRRESERLDDW